MKNFGQVMSEENLDQQLRSYAITPKIALGGQWHSYWGGTKNQNQIRTCTICCDWEPFKQLAIIYHGRLLSSQFRCFLRQPLSQCRSVLAVAPEHTRAHCIMRYMYTQSAIVHVFGELQLFLSAALRNLNQQYDWCSIQSPQNSCQNLQGIGRCCNSNLYSNILIICKTIVGTSVSPVYIH